MTCLLDKNNIPCHIAIIMDGNGRWARSRHLPTITGYRAGAEVARQIVQHAESHGVKHLTLYVFSKENWKRSAAWIDDIMGLLRWYLQAHIEDLMQNGVRICIVGCLEGFPQDVKHLISSIVQKTAHNKRITVHLAIGYSGRDDLLRAMRKMTCQIQDGSITAENLNEAYVSSQLDTANVPDPDLLIRTSGELRVSNFLLWNIAYTEFVFHTKMWPDFTADDFDCAIQEFQKRQRRYGY